MTSVMLSRRSPSAAGNSVSNAATTDVSATPLAGDLAKIDQALGQLVPFDQREEEGGARHHHQTDQQVEGAHRRRPGQEREDIEDRARPYQEITQAARQPDHIPSRWKPVRSQVSRNML